MDKIISTAKLISMYIEDNNIKIEDLASASNVNSRTVRRILNDECKLSYDVAFGLQTLIPELKAEFLASYDSKYQIQKNEILRSLNIKKAKEIIDFFRLKKLYPQYKDNTNKLIEKGLEVFGETGFSSGVFISPFSQVVFSKANNEILEDSTAWTVAAYREYLSSSVSEPYTFNKEIFLSKFHELKQITASTSYEGAIVNMSKFCKACGINFYIRESIANARIKGVCIKDSDGHIFIMLSTLFRCVESMLIAFVHECFHLKNNDFDNPALTEEGRTAENEHLIDKETRYFFIKDNQFTKEQVKAFRAKDIYMIAKKNESSPGIVASIARCESSVFDNQKVNSLLHFYKV